MPARYSLFEKVGNEWVRMTSKSYFKSTAQMVWFDELAAPYTHPERVRGLRKLKAVRF
jgi:hypothetical protein